MLPLFSGVRVDHLLLVLCMYYFSYFIFFVGYVCFPCLVFVPGLLSLMITALTLVSLITLAAKNKCQHPTKRDNIDLHFQLD